MTTQGKIRIGSYLSVLVLMAVWKIVALCRPPAVSRTCR